MLWHDTHNLTLDEQVALLASGSQADVGFPGLARTVDDTSHHGNLDGEFQLLEPVIRFGCDGDHVDLCPATRWTRNQVESRALPQPEVLEERLASLGLFNGVGSEREPDRVADALIEQGCDPRDGLDQPTWQAAQPP